MTWKNVNSEFQKMWLASPVISRRRSLVLKNYVDSFIFTNYHLSGVANGIFWKGKLNHSDFFIGEGANVTSFVVNNIPISRPKSVACLDMWFRTLANTFLLPRGVQQLFQFMKSHCLLLPPASKSYLDIGNNLLKYEIFEAFWIFGIVLL